MLAALDIFDTLEPAWLTRLAQRLMATQPGWYAIVLADRSGRIVFDTAARPGEAARIGDTEWIARVVSTRRPAVSNLFRDAVAGDYFFMIAVPVMDADTVRYVLAAKVRSSSLSEILRRQRPRREVSWRWSIECRESWPAPATRPSTLASCRANPSGPRTHA